MTENKIKAKCEALNSQELSSKELDAVSGGNKAKDAENQKQAAALKGFQQALQAL
jgi:hypothetical protein